MHNGEFRMEFQRQLDAEHGVVRAHFLGDFGAAPSQSEPVTVHD